MSAYFKGNSKNDDVIDNYGDLFTDQKSLLTVYGFKKTIYGTKFTVSGADLHRIRHLYHLKSFLSFRNSLENDGISLKQSMHVGSRLTFNF